MVFSQGCGSTLADSAVTIEGARSSTKRKRKGPQRSRLSAKDVIKEEMYDVRTSSQADAENARTKRHRGIRER
jgi:hypothetical protein